MKLVSVSEMKAIEQQADASGLSYAQMMENAGRGLAEMIYDLIGDESGKEIFGLVGSGNNGGDTLVALAHLARAGWRTRAYCIKRKTDELAQRLLEAGGEIISAEEDDEFIALATFIESADILLDGLLGTGIKLPLKPEMASVLSVARSSLNTLDNPPFVIAVDCPSGVDCDTGAAADECLAADLTVTMAAVKQGLLRLPAFDLVGELEVVDIGLPDNLPAWTKITRTVPDPDGSRQSCRRVPPTRTKARLAPRSLSRDRSVTPARHISRPRPPTASARASSRWRSPNPCIPRSRDTSPK